jgi:hypothetical protein
MTSDESAKAVQEVAKTTRDVLPLVKQFGEWVGRLIGGPAEQGIGIVTDHLVYVRWERKQRLMKRADELMKEQGMVGPTRPVTPKVAIPLLQAATLEENNDLQDRWARLLVNAARMDSTADVTRALVTILSDFGPMEANLLDALVSAPPNAKTHGGFVATRYLPEAFVDDVGRITSESEREPPREVAIALWNLVRLGCVVTADSWGGGATITMVKPSALGEALVSACTLPDRKST